MLILNGTFSGQICNCLCFFGCTGTALRSLYLTHSSQNVKFFDFFFAFSIIKGLTEYVVKILAMKFELKKSYGKKLNFPYIKTYL